MDFFGERTLSGSLIDFSASEYLKFLKKTILRMSGDVLESIIDTISRFKFCLYVVQIQNIAVPYVGMKKC
jgi:hypothetical protein